MCKIGRKKIQLKNLINSNYLGTPESAYDSQGNKVWEREIDIYGKVKKGDSIFVPFLYQGQYFDSETDLAYNRFRYYSPETGTYISQDPIGLAGGNATFYAYTKDSNIWLDPFGLDVYELTAATDGWYPVYEYGTKDPVSYTKLQQGDTYKIGESQRSSTRYSDTRLESARINRSRATSVAVDANGRAIIDINGNITTAGLDMSFIDQGNTKQADRILENQELIDYHRQNGELPAGNKSFH